MIQEINPKIKFNSRIYFDFSSSIDEQLSIAVQISNLRKVFVLLRQLFTMSKRKRRSAHQKMTSHQIAVQGVGSMLPTIMISMNALYMQRQV